MSKVNQSEIDRLMIIYSLLSDSLEDTPIGSSSFPNGFVATSGFVSMIENCSNNLGEALATITMLLALLGQEMDGRYDNDSAMLRERLTTDSVNLLRMG